FSEQLAPLLGFWTVWVFRLAEQPPEEFGQVPPVVVGQVSGHSARGGPHAGRSGRRARLAPYGRRAAGSASRFGGFVLRASGSRCRSAGRRRGRSALPAGIHPAFASYATRSR